MKQILVPTDFSECAKNASDTAIEIAKHYGAQLHFYHFMSIPIDWLNLNLDENRIYPDVTAQVNRIQQELDELVRLANKHGVEARSFLSFADSADAIPRYAREHGISMIIMGSHGAQGIKELIMGSNAQKVVRNSRIPVLILKQPMTSLEVRNVLFVSDFEPEMAAPFEKVVDFAEKLGAKIHLLFINTPSDFHQSWEIEERMESFVALASKNLGQKMTINASNFEEGLEKYCELHPTGFLAIATHHRRGLSRVFEGSLTEKIVNHVNVPIMSFPIND